MRRILLSVDDNESILAVTTNGKLTELMVERSTDIDLVGSIYKGIVKNVVPAIDGLFVDIGIGQNAFLRKKDLIEPKRIPTEGSTILVQVVKENTEMKGPLVTEHVSIAGKYAVTLAGTNYIGVSKKIRDEKVRSKLNRIAMEVSGNRMGLVIRTDAQSADPDIFKADISNLFYRWDILQKRYGIEKAPAILYRESDIVVKALRNYMTLSTDLLVTDDKKTYERLLEINGDEKITTSDKISLYDDHIPLINSENINEQINRLLDRRVELPSGGFLVIDHTEALVVIDVNSGSFRQKGIPHGEAAYLINREAAYEIARQIRLRGIGGMILIDFIDMEKDRQKREIVDILAKEAKKDRVKTIVHGMTSLGLVEMTRKRSVHGLFNHYYEICPLCKGTGHILSEDTILQKLHRELKSMQRGVHGEGVLIQCHPDIGRLLEEEAELKYLRQITHRSVMIEKSAHLSREAYSILAVRE